jgi:hypothetical protein
MKSKLSIQILTHFRLINQEMSSIVAESERQEMIFIPSVCARCEKIYIPGYITDWKALGFCTPECYISEMLTIGRKPETISPAHKHQKHKIN